MRTLLSSSIHYTVAAGPILGAILELFCVLIVSVGGNFYCGTAEG